MTIHIMSKELPPNNVPEWYYTRCGLSRIVEGVPRVCATYLDMDSWLGYGSRKPTCETCILIHWVDPVGTADVESYSKLRSGLFNKNSILVEDDSAFS